MYNYNYDYDYGTVQAASNFAGAGIWMIIAAVLALVGGILVYYLFIKPEKEQTSPFLARMKEFLRFNHMLIEGLLKVFYVIGAIFLTLSAFAYFAVGFAGVLLFLLQITLGNVLLRVIYEAALIKVMIWKNTTELNKKMK